MNIRLALGSAALICKEQPQDYREVEKAKDGQFLQDCTMEEMIEHCAQFVGAVNEGLEKPITKEEYIGQMKMWMSSAMPMVTLVKTFDVTHLVKVRIHYKYKIY